MKKITVTVLGAAFSLTALGQDLLQCVNPDVAGALLTSELNTTNLVVTADRPALLADFEAPPAFEWIGTMTTDFETKAAFKTDLNVTDAHDVFVAALRQAGFEARASDETFGFVLTGPPFITSICRNMERGAVIVRERSGAAFVTVSNPTQVRRQSCDEAMAAPELPFMQRGFGYIPKLMLAPSITNSTRLGALPTGSGSGSAFSSTVEVEGVSSMESMAGSLADQIAQQGWIADASWSGTRSAGSTWTREVDGGTKLAGKLTIAHLNDGYHGLEFKVILLN